MAQDVTKTTDAIYSDCTYLENNANWHLEDTPWKAAEILRIVGRNKVDWQHAVEVGCGTGGIVYELARVHADRQFSGFDISRDAAAFWPRFNLPNLKLSHEDFLNSKMTADLLLLIDVFEHVEDYMGFLRRLRGRSRWFVFHIPLDLHVQGLLRNRQISAREIVGHLHYFSQATALATLRDCGFNIVDSFLTDVAFEANKSTRALRTRLLNPVRRLAAAISPEKTALLLGGYSLMVLARAE
jgi:SAM-dependent methyltransferase